jgi:bile acid-coenzyme A ligase
MAKFAAEQWLALVEKHHVSFAYMVPTTMTRIAKLDPALTAHADLSSITTLVHTAAPCPPSIKRWWIDRVGGSHILEIYGGSERIGATIIDGEEWLRHPGSVGRPMPGQQIVILGANGDELPPGEIGEVCVRRAVNAPRTLRLYRFRCTEPRRRRWLRGYGPP